MTRVFEDQKLLEAFKARREYPAIHEPMYEAIATESVGHAFIDVGACFGLLAQQIKDRMRLPVIAMEPEQEYVDRGRAAGIDVPFFIAPLNDSTLHEGFTRMLEKFKVDTVILRRVLRQVFLPDDTFAERLLKVCRDHKVKEIWLQGGRSPKTLHVDPFNPRSGWYLTTTAAGVQLLERSKLYRVSGKWGRRDTPVACLIPA